MKRLLLSSVLLGSTLLEAQTWSELPVVAPEYTAYTTTRLKVDPVTLTPYVAFKARKNVTTGEEYTHALVYRFVNGAWQQVAASTDQVYSNYLDFGFSKTGRAYIAYADADSTIKGTTIEHVIPAAHASKLLAANTENAQATYLGLGVLSDDKIVTACTGNTSSTYKSVVAVTDYDAKNNIVTAGLGPTEKMQIYKSTLCSSDSNKVYLAAMERATPYAIHVYELADGVWSELGKYPTEGVNDIFAGTFKLSTDTLGHIYTLTSDNATGESRVRIRQFDAQTQQWSTVGDAPTPILASSRYQIAAHDVRPDGVHVVAYQDLANGSRPTVITLDPVSNTWSEPVILSDVAGNNSGSMSLEFAGNGIGYVNYLDADNGVRVCRYDPVELSHTAFDGLICDTLSAQIFQVPTSQGSAKVFDYTSSLSGQQYALGGYAYNSVLRDEWGTESFRDTTLIGMNIRSRLSNGVQTGIFTTGAARPLKASRVRVCFIYYNSSSMKGRTLTIRGSHEPFAHNETLVGNEVQGDVVAQLIYGPNGVFDIDLSDYDYPYLGFHTTSTGFGIREIVIGWVEDSAIEQVRNDYGQTQRIYTLSGQELSAQGQLPSGIYIEHRDGKASKTIIR